MRASEGGAEDVGEEVGGSGVFEPTFAAFGQWSANGAGDDDVIGRFAEKGFAAARDIGGGGGKVRRVYFAV